MVLREDPRQEQFGQIEIDAAGRIRRILGPGGSGGESAAPDVHRGPRDGAPVSRLYSTGCEDLRQSLRLHQSPEQWRSPLWRRHRTVIGLDAGTPERYLQVNEDALDQRCKFPYVDPLEGFALSPRKDVADVVRMGESVQLGTDVRVNPPVLLGDGTKVGANAVVGPYSVVGAKVVIGKEARLSHAVVLEGAKVEAGVQLKRCIVGRKASLYLDEPGPTGVSGSLCVRML